MIKKLCLAHHYNKCQYKEFWLEGNIYHFTSKRSLW